MTTPVLIVDGNNLITRNIHATKQGDAKAGVWNGGIHTSLLVLMKLVELYRPSRVYMTYDSGFPKFRRALVPSYKVARHEKHKDRSPDDVAAFAQVETCVRVFEELGCTTLRYPNFEADDLMALSANRRQVKKQRSIIISGDRDLWQCIGPYTDVHYLSNTTAGLIDEDEMFERVGIHVSEYVLYKTLLGDSSDGVAGLFGAGDKRVKKMIECFRADFGDCDPTDQLYLMAGVYKNANEDKLESWEKRLVGNVTALRNSMAVMDLGYDELFSKKQRKDVYAQMDVPKAPPLSIKGVVRVLQRLGLMEAASDPRRYHDTMQAVYERKDR